jgi:hypothetical protein
MMWKLTKLAWAIRCLIALLSLSTVVSAEDPSGRIYETIKGWPVSASAKGYTETKEDELIRKATMSLAIGHTYEPGPIPEQMLQIATLVVWHGESGFALDVHSGGRGRAGSDGGKAACMGQLHRNRVLTRPHWESTKGLTLEATLNCAQWTAWALQYSAKLCKWDGTDEGWRRTLRQYGSGSGDCDPEKATPRSIKETKRRVAKIWEVKARMK